MSERVFQRWVTFWAMAIAVVLVVSTATCEAAFRRLDAICAAVQCEELPR